MIRFFSFFIIFIYYKYDYYFQKFDKYFYFLIVVIDYQLVKKTLNFDKKTIFLRSYLY